uniref:Scleraxis bHLH transcription factor n=1 Tax=Cyclopterus lumpus TaxID=8103 RepID=A0A8C2YX37_CYCLU
MTFAMLRAAPPAGRFLYGDIRNFRLSSSSPSAFHIKVNRKRKLCGAGGGGGMDVGVRQRTAANARERDRTNSVNTAFTALRTLIPHREAVKIETLRLASSYISHLGNVLLLGEGLHDGQPCHAPSPPFFHVNSSPNRGSDQSAQPKHICTFCLSNQRKMRGFFFWGGGDCAVLKGQLGV